MTKFWNSFLSLIDNQSHLSCAEITLGSICLAASGNNQAIYLEVEKVASESVFHFLQNQDKTVFYFPDRTEMDKYVYLGSTPIIVKNLVSESPLQRIKEIKIPTLEKLLVDMYCDPDFYYLQGGEYWRIMHNAHSYAINTSKMFRYATRRNAAVEIKEIWNESIIYYD